MKLFGPERPPPPSRPPPRKSNQNKRKENKTSTDTKECLLLPPYCESRPEGTLRVCVGIDRAGGRCAEENQHCSLLVPKLHLRPDGTIFSEPGTGKKIKIIIIIKARLIGSSSTRMFLRFILGGASTVCTQALVWFLCV